MYLSPHARSQAIEKGFDVAAVFAAAANPDISYPSRRFPGQRRNIKNGICAVVEGERVVTVYAHRVETAPRPDQVAAKGKPGKDAREYARKFNRYAK